MQSKSNQALQRQHLKLKLRFFDEMVGTGNEGT